MTEETLEIAILWLADVYNDGGYDECYYPLKETDFTTVSRTDYELLKKYKHKLRDAYDRTDSVLIVEKMPAFGMAQSIDRVREFQAVEDEAIRHRKAQQKKDEKARLERNAEKIRAKELKQLEELKLKYGSEA